MEQKCKPVKGKHHKKSKKGNPKNPEHQNPSGVSNDPQIGRFQTTQQEIVELPIDSIQSHTLIPDYRDPTESTLPIVVQTPEGYYCIDGWNLIEQTKAAGQSAIRCHIFHIQEHSETELAIRKVAIRTKPQGGTGSYAELVRNTYFLFKCLMDEMENPIVFSHGGPRRGENFTSNKEDDLREVLSERLGKDRNTINDYLNFGRYITDEVMDTLVTQNTPKAFFEKARSNKRRLVTNLESDGLAQENIAMEVSNKMSEWFNEYQRTGEIKPYSEEPEAPEESEDQDIEVIDGDGEVSPAEAEIFQHRSPIEENGAPESPTEETIKSEIKTTIEVLSEFIVQSPLDCNRGIEIVGGQIRQLAMVQQMLIDIRNRAENEENREET